MCGIAGILRFDGQSVEQDLLKRMTDIIAHRGPDGEGQWCSGPVGLGHRRLSIIDLSSHANQPMLSDDKQLVIVFNGEIYNYQELTQVLADNGVQCRTTSDTEVILNMYKVFGPTCVTQFRGMFAFAIWDEAEQHLFIARDRVGIKPLYYLRKGEVFVFASEIKAVAASGCSDLRVSRTALTGLMRFLVVPQPDSIFDDIYKLQPGRTLLVRTDGSVREDVYWEPDVTTPLDESCSEDEWIAAMDESLLESVRYHMVADVPVSAFLSGGLDSSAVVTLMRQQSPTQQFDTFSIGFPGQGKYDESSYARKVAELNQVDCHMHTINESFMDDLGSMAWHLDEPFAISSAFATYYLAKHAAKKTKVVLTGDGGDELFAGYLGYTNNHYMGSVAGVLPITTSYHILLSMMCSSRSRSPALLRILNGLGKRIGSEGLRYSHQVAQNSFLGSSAAFAPDFFYPAISAWPKNMVAHYYDSLGSEDRLRRKLFAEYKTRLVDEMLMKVDRMTMAHSLEARVPLLDHKVVEFAYGLPSHMKLRQQNNESITKYILKRTMESHLPEDIIYRKKQGFNVPVKSWLTGKFLGRVGDSILGGRLREAGVINPAGVGVLLKQQEAGQYNHNNLLMLLLVMEYWTEAYESRVGAISWA
jgi:asparagine synthase (glutamine-hydrolysing)